MEHYAIFVKIGGGVWSVTVMERDSNEDVHELARDYTDAERGTLDVLADLGWEPIGARQTTIVSGAGMGYSRPVRRRPTPADVAETPLSASVLDVLPADAFELDGVPVFIAARDLVQLVADVAELWAATPESDRATVETMAADVARARGYIPSAARIGTVRS